MKLTTTFLSIAFVWLIATSAIKISAIGNKANTYRFAEPTITPCLTRILSLNNASRQGMAEVKIQNTKDSLYITYNATGDREISEVNLFVGHRADMHFKGDQISNLHFGTFNLFAQPTKTITFAYAVSELPGDVLILAGCKLRGTDKGVKFTNEQFWNDGAVINANEPIKSFEYPMPICRGNQGMKDHGGIDN